MCWGAQCRDHDRDRDRSQRRVAISSNYAEGIRCEVHRTSHRVVDHAPISVHDKMRSSLIEDPSVYAVALQVAWDERRQAPSR